jgi:hypothetical protein
MKQEKNSSNIQENNSILKCAFLPPKKKTLILVPEPQAINQYTEASIEGAIRGVNIKSLPRCLFY